MLTDAPCHAWPRARQTGSAAAAAGVRFLLSLVRIGCLWFGFIATRHPATQSYRAVTTRLITEMREMRNNEKGVFSLEK